MAALKFNFKRGNTTRVTMKNAHASTTINAGDPVELGTDGVQPISADGNALFGIAHEDIPAGSTGAITVSCGSVWEADLATGFDPARGDEVDVNTNGKLKAQVGTAIGRIVDIDPSSGASNARVFLYPLYT